MAYIGGKPAASTGFLLSSNVVLTTAHSVMFSGDNNIIKAKPKEIVFYPQICGKLDQTKANKVVEYRVCK